MTEAPFSNRELKSYFEGFDKKLQSQETKIDKILSNDLEFGERLILLEERTKDYSETKKMVEAHDRYKWWIAGIVACVSAVGGIFLTTINNNLSYRIEKETEAVVNKKINQEVKK